MCTLSSFCIILLFASSCVDHRANNQEGELKASIAVPMQATVDSASELYLEVRNSILLDTVQKRSEQLEQLGLKVDLD